MLTNAHFISTNTIINPVKPDENYTTVEVGRWTVVPTYWFICEYILTNYAHKFTQIFRQTAHPVQEGRFLTALTSGINTGESSHEGIL